MIGSPVVAHGVVDLTVQLRTHYPFFARISAPLPGAAKLPHCPGLVSSFAAVPADNPVDARSVTQGAHADRPQYGRALVRLALHQRELPTLVLPADEAQDVRAPVHT